MVLRAGAFFAVFLAAAFFAGAFLAVFLAAVFFAGAFLAGFAAEGSTNFLADA